METRLAVKSGRLRIGLLIAAACLPALRTKSDEPAKAEKPAADSMLGKEAGDVRDDNGLKMKLVWCPPGAFNMEHLDEIAVNNGPKFVRIEETRTAVKVMLTRGYWLGKHELTQAEWMDVMKTEPWKGKDCTKEGADFPVTWVSWKDAMEFCRQLTEAERNAGRLPDTWEYNLPTEAQWERACRARTETRFSFGDDASHLGDYAWFDENTLNVDEVYPHRVGQKKSNPWGLHDLHGNVSEWCRDFYSDQLPGRRDPEVTNTSHRQVARGGCCLYGASICGSSNRDSLPPNRRPAVGFRVALTPVRPAK